MAVNFYLNTIVMILFLFSSSFLRHADSQNSFPSVCLSFFCSLSLFHSLRVEFPCLSLSLSLSLSLLSSPSLSFIISLSVILSLAPSLSLSLSHARHPPLSVIATRKFSRRYSLFAQSWWIYVFAGLPKLVCPYVGVYCRTSLINLSLLPQQSPICFVRLTCMVCVVRPKLSCIMDSSSTILLS